MTKIPDYRFTTLGVDNRFPAPGVDNRYTVPSVIGFVPPIGGILTDEVSELSDVSGFALTGTVTHANQKFSLSASSRVTLNIAALNGEHWVYTNQKVNAGTFRARFLSPTYSPEATRNVSGGQIWKFPAVPGSTSFDFLTGAGADVELEAVQIFDMAEILARPCDVYIAMGQSLMACSTSSLGLDEALDGWDSTRLLQWPGKTYAGRGTVRNEINACAAPLQMGDNEPHSAICSGVSPAVAFMKGIEPGTAPGRNAIIICAAISGTGLTAADAPWNSKGSNPFAYNNAVALTNAAMAALPAGSKIKGVLWAQGEADTSADMSNYPPAFASTRSDFETAVNGGEQLPWIIIAGPPNATRANQAHFIQTQLNMDQASGHAFAQSLVHTVERPVADMEDSTHPAASNQRAAGAIAAARFRSEGY